MDKTDLFWQQNHFLVRQRYKRITERQRKLLREVRQLLDDIYAEDIVSSGDLNKVYEKIVRELGDE